MRKTIIGVMGPGDDATAAAKEAARHCGWLIAQQGWVLLTGGRNCGVMEAAGEGASGANGIVVGVLPEDGPGKGESEHLSISIFTGMGQARNNINVLSADAVVVCGMNPGTASEVALALRAHKHIILLEQPRSSLLFFQELGGELIHPRGTPEEAIQAIKELLG